ncbi:3-ketoacyl-CoA thiolase [Magnaporthiopsis poae ATCC 64411]|uniref:3-ketoacyl-CoA thiolase n=1 Tax=Magnaporthiopsis poae (strain ATCC 64411 / 73-15) TaxID=644358 RepID=A0A0C4DNA7_MAGP6|nr:3-ketoacyl-CoA thiolase [Magnaporthiopsis poae ATCC 64411]
MAAERLGSILKHLTPGNALSTLTSKNDDDVVITLAVRTPLAKAKKGGFKDTTLEYLIYALLQQVREKSKLDPALVEDICMGNVSDGKAAYKLRAAALAAGFPNTAGASSLNRFCSSGLKATQDIANAISAGSIQVGIAMGAESMTIGGDALDQPFDEDVTKASQEAQDCMQPMGWTSENVSRDFGITREEMDRYAALSFQKAERAQKAGLFDEEIVPIKTKVKGADGEVKEVIISKDEGIRPGTTAETLGKIRVAFPQWGADHDRRQRQPGHGRGRRRPPDEALDGRQAGPAHRGQIVTGLAECRRQGKKILLTSMCIGTGMGMAGLFVSEQ